MLPNLTLKAYHFVPKGLKTIHKIFNHHLGHCMLGCGSRRIFKLSYDKLIIYIKLIWVKSYLMLCLPFYNRTTTNRGINKLY